LFADERNCVCWLSITVARLRGIKEDRGLPKTNFKVQEILIKLNVRKQTPRNKYEEEK